MKFTPTCFLVLSLLPTSQAFAPQPTSRPLTTGLNAHNEVGGWLGPAAATVAGWALAAQMAFANPMVVVDQPVARAQIADSTTIVVADKVEFLDFAMPSYGAAVGGDTVTGAKSAPDIPSFNPFGSSVSEPVAPPKEDTSAADAKAAAEAKKAEEKAAAEAKKAEEEAKKAEKEARRQAELEKQKEAVERAKQKKAEEAAAAAASKEESAPEISIPSFSVPEMPEIKVPEMPKFSMPKLEIPDAPEMPKVDAPKMPEFSAPKIPEFSAPKVSMPSFDAPKSSGGYDFDVPTSSSFSTPADDVEPQEVRDARAKEARTDFLKADDEAKEVERQARALRDVANQKKKIAKELKDEACKTRIGGKFLCLRPLGSGY